MKAFVFDADGVICVGANFGVALEKEHQIDPAHLVSFFTGPFNECILGVRDLKKEIAPFLSEWGWRGSTEELIEFWFQREHVLCSDALACVRALRAKGHVCALGTNQEKYRAAYLREEMGLAQEFDQILPSCELGAAKPSPEFFVRVQKQLGQPPSNLCLVDDTRKNVIGALAAGWSSIHYRSAADISEIEKLSNERPTVKATEPVAPTPFQKPGTSFISPDAAPS